MNFAEKLSAKIEEQLKIWEIPSATVAVVQNGQTLLCNGFGLRDYDHKKADGDTLYQIASCSKAFTAAAAAVLATEGKLDFDTPIIEYMPDFRLNDRYATENLTVRDFLSHRSGLPRHEYAWYGTGFSRQQLMKNLKDLPLTAPIRYTYQYSNFNYLIIGCLIERISGMEFEEFLMEKLIKPIGMTRTVARAAYMRADENHALPFAHEGDYGMTGVRAIPFYRSPAENEEEMVGDPTAAAGCVCSCASDMVKWLEFNINKGKVGDVQLVREDLMELIQTTHIETGNGGIHEPQRTMTSYGLGWSIYSYRGLKMMEHGGNINGFTSSTAFIPAKGIGVFVSLNMDVALLTEAIVQYAIDELLGEEDADWFCRIRKYNSDLFEHVKEYYASLGGEKRENTVPSHPIAEYAGTYEAPGYRRFLITEENGKLTADFNTFVVGLKHHNYDSFTTEETVGELPPGMVITFAADPKGEIRTLSVQLGSEKGLKPIVFTKS